MVNPLKRSLKVLKNAFEIHELYCRLTDIGVTGPGVWIYLRRKLPGDVPRSLTRFLPWAPTESCGPMWSRKIHQRLRPTHPEDSCSAPAKGPHLEPRVSAILLDPKSLPLRILRRPNPCPRSCFCSTETKEGWEMAGNTVRGATPAQS